MNQFELGSPGEPASARPAASKRTEAFASSAAGGRNLDVVMRIPVTVQVILGMTTMPVANLMKLGRGAILALDNRVGEPVDVVVNGRVVARGEVVVVEEDTARLGVSLTEIVAPNGAGKTL